MTRTFVERVKENIGPTLDIPAPDVNTNEKVMVRGYGAVRNVAKSKSLDLRTAAFVLGIQRVGRAALARYPIRETINFD